MLACWNQKGVNVMCEASPFAWLPRDKDRGQVGRGRAAERGRKRQRDKEREKEEEREGERECHCVCLRVCFLIRGFIVL